MGVSLFVAVVYITVNFLVDLLYGVIDPRIRSTGWPPRPPSRAAASVCAGRAARPCGPRRRGGSRWRSSAWSSPCSGSRWRCSRRSGAGRPAGPGLRAAAGAVAGAPVRHRRARPRHPQPRHYGARLTLPLALLLVVLSLLIGGLLGMLAGYFRGVWDGAVMRLTDLVFAFPASSWRWS